VIESVRPRVLVVDDEPNVLATLQPILAREGFDVHVAADEPSARRAVDNNGGFDVVITDLRLGDADGLSVARHVHERDIETPVIVLTGFGSLESAVDAMHKGVFDYLLKPCDVDELRSTVRRALDHGRLARGLKDRVSALERIAGRDVTDAEKQLRVAREEVESLARDLDGAKRELELALGRERAMVAQLRERDELRNQFLANVSHELRTPLTSIRGYAQLLSRSDATLERVRTGAAAILRATDQLHSLVQDLLDMTAIEGNGLRVDPRALTLTDVVTAAVQLAEPAARDKGLAVAADLPNSLPEVRADRGRLAQVLNNLLSNAIKFTPERGHIEVGARTGGDLVHVWVKDSGVGIPREEQTQLFTRFFHSSTTPLTSRGLGLGLYIVRSIVEAHGGMIWIESEPGHGTAVNFTLPVSIAAATAVG
jgi:signal transduction histidine kinase